MEENKSNNTNLCCAQTKTPFLFGVIGFVVVVLLFLTLADKVGVGVSSVITKRSITVTGSANRQEANQIASFNATVSSKNADKAKAVAQVNEKSQKLVSELKTFGIADKDLKTQSLNIYREQTPYWEEGVQKYKDGDWNASISVDMILRDVSKASDLAELLAKADTSNVWGPNYSLSEGEPEKAELLNQAFENAKRKAESLAKSMNLRVGKVISIVEGSDYGVVYPYRDSGMGGGGAALEPGSTNVSTSLTVTFELR